MADLLKKITLDEAELDICDDTARSASTANAKSIETLTTNVNDLKAKKCVNVTYDGTSSALVITHN